VDINDQKQHEDTDEETQAGPSSYASATIPWEIDNKYYTASVDFKAYPQEIYDISQLDNVEVVMYIFEGVVCVSFDTIMDGTRKLMFRLIHYRQFWLRSWLNRGI
jgi:hypothetical protein